MHHEIATTVVISAPAARVWEVLMDFPRYAEWNPFVLSIAGQASVGSSLTVVIAQPGGKTMTIRPTVSRHALAGDFAWKGKVLLRSLLDAEHYFRVAQLADGTTRFDHGERFNGMLVPLLRRTLEGSTKAGFEAMNLALKRRVEQSTD